MAIMPGVQRALISKNYTPRATDKTAVILHTADSSATGGGHFRYWNRDPRAGASSHFYVDKSGLVWQLVDTAHIAWTSGNANEFSIGIETQGYGSEPWTPEQVKALARILAWCSKTHGIRLDLMTRRGRYGIGYHRLGVPRTRAELKADRRREHPVLWSSAVGKICPGAKREKQIPYIIKLAKGHAPIVDENGDDELNDKQAKQLTAIFDTLTRGREHVKYDGEIWGLIQDVKATTSRLDQRLARLEAGTIDADVLGDPKAKGIANALRRMWRAVEPPAGTDPTQPESAAWNRWRPWRFIFADKNKGEQN